METKHTKGEWSLNSDFCEVNGTKHYVGEIYGTNPERYESIASIQCCSHIRNPLTAIHREEAEANAKLIAAAPEMIDCLYSADAALEIIKRNATMFYSAEEHEKIKKAIKKATE